MKLKSFLGELEQFYLKSWNKTKKAGYSYKRIAESILEAAGQVGGLMPDYASYILTSSGPLLVGLKRKGECFFERVLRNLSIKLEVRWVRELMLDVLGLLNKPGRGFWLYAYSHDYRRILVVRVNPRDPRSFAQKVCFKRVLVRAKNGALLFIPALNKAYRYSPTLVFKVCGDIELLPHLEPEQIVHIRRGLVIPSLLVETPIPLPSGKLVRGLGFVAVVSDVKIKRTLGDEVILNIAGQTLRLDSAYAPPGKGQGSAVLLLFLNYSGLDGYYLGSVTCNPAKNNLACYLPRGLFVDIEAVKAACIIDALPNKLLRFYEEMADNESYRAIRRAASTRRNALKKFYCTMGNRKVYVPNPELISYKELLTWLAAAKHLRKYPY